MAKVRAMLGRELTAIFGRGNFHTSSLTKLFDLFTMKHTIKKNKCFNINLTNFELFLEVENTTDH